MRSVPVTRTKTWRGWDVRAGGCGNISCVFLARTLPPPYSWNKISTFNGLLGGRRSKIFITKEFDAESRKQRTYGRFVLLAADSPLNEIRNRPVSIVRRVYLIIRNHLRWGGPENRDQRSRVREQNIARLRGVPTLRQKKGEGMGTPTLPVLICRSSSCH
jgi:hypothetical protein